MAKAPSHKVLALMYLYTLSNHPLSKDDRSGCPITSQIVCFSSSLADQFSSNVFNRVLQLNLVIVKAIYL